MYVSAADWRIPNDILTEIGLSDINDIFLCHLKDFHTHTLSQRPTENIIQKHNQRIP